VQWIAVVDVPFELFSHIRNPLNSSKPVKISRDGQELAGECLSGCPFSQLQFF
jgi:hypothetical protein